MAKAPTLRGGPKGCFVLRPIVQAGRIEVGTGGPNHGLNFRIEADLSEHGGVAKRTEEFSFKDGLKVDGAAQAVVEAQPQCVRRDMLEGGDAVNGMIHGVMLLQGRNRRGFAALLKQLPVGQQLSRVQFGPGLDQSLLPLRKKPNDQPHGRD